MTCIITRRAQFSASHRYWLDELSINENQRLFGPCTRSPGHGHNYELFVSLARAETAYGMVINLTEAKRVIQREVIEPLDFSYLNEAWPEFSQTLPTTENIARAVWHRLKPHLPVVSVQLRETSELWAEYKGIGMEAYLTVSSHFSAAHRLALPDLTYEENCKIYGKCARPHGHGHNYQLEVTVCGQMDTRTGMIVDLVELQSAIAHTVIDPFDHTFLNKDIPYFSQVVPTAENIVLHIRELLTEPIAALGVRLHKIKLIESRNNSAEVYAKPEMTETPTSAEPTFAQI